MKGNCGGDDDGDGDDDDDSPSPPTPRLSAPRLAGGYLLHLFVFQCPAVRLHVFPLQHGPGQLSSADHMQLGGT